jgi:hypothetical protein
MKTKSYFAGLLAVACSLHFSAQAQKSTRYNLAQVLNQNGIDHKPGQQTKVLEGTLPGAISTIGSVTFKKITFSQGTLDIDLRGKNVFLQSFLGITFHGVDTTTYDVLYFRPFNFKHADTARRKWSVAYMSLPKYDYAVLRKEHPLVYENAVDPVPNPEDWFHATIVIKGDHLAVYVNHSAKPCLELTLLNARRDGILGLFSDGLSSDFANLTITPAK